MFLSSSSRSIRPLLSRRYPEPQLCFSPTQPTTVYGKDRAVHVVGRVRGQKDRRALEVLRLTPPACGDAGEQVLGALGILAQRDGHLGRHVAGSNGVDVYALSRPLVRQGSGEVGDPGLGRGVRGHQDAPLARLDEVPGDRLAEVERATQVDAYDVLPVLLSKLERRRPADETGVVDEDVEAPQNLRAVPDDLPGPLSVRAPQVEVQGVAAPAPRRDPLAGLVER